ncbi:MAG: aminotransferase class I/II-fold pyridoxal phosphate-dependent enzyme [Patescibacteria group bacterium]|jgi:aspartate/methionine/tyrosine aminotransferase
MQKITTSEYADLTQHELEALKHEFNLADAHTHQSQSLTQRKIISRLPSLWYQSERATQVEMENKFIRSFFQYHQQPTALKTPSLLVYAASIGMVIVSNYFKKKQLSVQLITPCFDNLPDLLRNLGVPIKPLREELLEDASAIYQNLERHCKSDVIFLVSPNNPTGFELTGNVGTDYKARFKELIRFAKNHNKILAFDFCFASFIVQDAKVPTFDVYSLLEKSGVSYIAIEDSGKTWPLQDAKVALIKASKNLYPELHNIHTAYLLNVSPFILNLVSEYCEDSIKDKGSSIKNLLERNRKIVKKELSGDLLEFMEPGTLVSVAWFKIRNSKIMATTLQKHLYRKARVYVLPGTYFFWDKPTRGERYIRIALARDTIMFKKAIAKVKKALYAYR